MTMTGADADALDHLALRLGNFSQQLRQVRSSLDVRLRNTPWHGDDAVGFRHDWSRSHQAALSRTADFLEQSASDLRRHAAEQRIASGAGTFGDLRPFLPPGPLLPGPSIVPWGIGDGGSRSWIDSLPFDELDRLVTGLKTLVEFASENLHLGGIGSALSLGLGVISAAFPEGTARLLAEAGEQVFGLIGNVASTWNFHVATEAARAAGQAIAPIAKVIPVLGIFGGAVAIAQHADGAFGPTPRLENQLGVAGGAMAMVGGALMLTPLAPIGVGVVAVGGVVSAASWAVENREQIGAFVNDAATRVGEVGASVVRSVDQHVDRARNAVADVASESLDAMADAVGGAAGFIKGLF